MRKKITTLILLLIFVIITIANIKMYISVKSNEEYLYKQLEAEKMSQEQTTKYYEETVLEELSNTQTLYRLKLCAENFFSTINDLWQENANEEPKNKLLDIIANEYKYENNITVDNVKERFTYFKHEETIISKAYQYNIKEGISMHLLSGYNICHDGSNKKNFQIMIVTDTNQNTFEVYPEDYLTKHGINESKLGSKVGELNNIEQIQKNDNNGIKMPIITNEKIAQDYFDLYIFNMKYDIEVAYNMLNKEYKEKRFPTIQDFKEYIESRKEIYEEEELRDYSEFETMDEYALYVLKRKKIEFAGYQVRYEEDNTRYICVDNYNNYYIFYATSPLNYTVALDTYTVDLPEFTEKYKVASIEEKVGYNIEKIVNALNAEDYRYVYSKLADEFKANYFKTYEDFEKYAKETFDIGNKVTYNKYTESKDLSTYKITLQGKNKTITKTIVMRLEDGTNFAMSFNVE